MAGVEQERGFASLGFLAEAAFILLRRRMLVPALLLLLVLTASNIVILRNLPPPEGAPSIAFMAAAFVRIAGLLILVSAINRSVVPTPRSRWSLDGGFWLFVLGTVAGFALVAGLDLLLEATDPIGLIVRSVISTLILAPFATWIVGMNVAKPLGWRPGRFMRDFGNWLPPLIFWSLLLLTPTGLLHAMLGARLMAGVGEAFWPLALLDGALSAVSALTGVGLNLAAYRRVAPR